METAARDWNKKEPSRSERQEKATDALGKKGVALRERGARGERSGTPTDDSCDYPKHRCSETYGKSRGFNSGGKDDSSNDNNKDSTLGLKFRVAKSISAYIPMAKKTG